MELSSEVPEKALKPQDPLRIERLPYFLALAGPVLESSSKKGKERDDDKNPVDEPDEIPISW